MSWHRGYPRGHRRKPPKQNPRAIQQRAYAAKKYWERKAKLLAMLGGVCARCGDSGSDLEFDHLPGTIKKQCVTFLIHYKWETVVEEAKKCQLLCPPCHKTVTDERNYEDAPF